MRCNRPSVSRAAAATAATSLTHKGKRKPASPPTHHCDLRLMLPLIARKISQSLPRPTFGALRPDHCPSRPLPCSPLPPVAPHLRCSALLLFYNTIFAFLVPLLLLVPLRRQATPQRASDPPRRRAPLDRANAQIESWLRLLLHPGAEQPGQQEQQRQQQQQQEQVVGMQGARGTLVLRWWVLLAVLWTACCVFIG